MTITVEDQKSTFVVANQIESFLMVPIHQKWFDLSLREQNIMTVFSLGAKQMQSEQSTAQFLVPNAFNQLKMTQLSFDVVFFKYIKYWKNKLFLINCSFFIF